MEQNPADKVVADIKKDFVAVGASHVHGWYAWAIVGIVAGMFSGLLYVANWQGKFSAGHAQIANQQEAVKADPAELHISDVTNGEGDKEGPLTIHIVSFKNGKPSEAELSFSYARVGEENFKPLAGTQLPDPQYPGSSLFKPRGFVQLPDGSYNIRVTRTDVYEYQPPEPPKEATQPELTPPPIELPDAPQANVLAQARNFIAPPINSPPTQIPGQSLNGPLQSSGGQWGGQNLPSGQYPVQGTQQIYDQVMVTLDTSAAQAADDTTAQANQDSSGENSGAAGTGQDYTPCACGDIELDANFGANTPSYFVKPDEGYGDYYFRFSIVAPLVEGKTNIPHCSAVQYVKRTVFTKGVKLILIGINGKKINMSREGGDTIDEYQRAGLDVQFFPAEGSEYVKDVKYDAEDNPQVELDFSNPESQVRQDSLNIIRWKDTPSIRMKIGQTANSKTGFVHLVLGDPPIETRAYDIQMVLERNGNSFTLRGVPIISSEQRYRSGGQQSCALKTEVEMQVDEQGEVTGSMAPPKAKFVVPTSCDFKDPAVAKIIKEVQGFDPLTDCAKPRPIQIYGQELLPGWGNR